MIQLFTCDDANKFNNYLKNVPEEDIFTDSYNFEKYKTGNKIAFRYSILLRINNGENEL